MRKRAHAALFVIPDEAKLRSGIQTYSGLPGFRISVGDGFRNDVSLIAAVKPLPQLHINTPILQYTIPAALSVV
jgi:hypothetical protein